MPPRDSNSGGSFPLNFNTLLALLTVAGSVLMVSRQLSSERPMATVGMPERGDGEQTVEARLWEDPFSPWTKLPESELKKWSNKGRLELSEKIRDIKKSTGDEKKLLLLPVMVPGGGYPESREARIRTRFAIVSALGESGYVPEDEEHLGVFQMPWPKSKDLGDVAEDKDKFERITGDPKEAADIAKATREQNKLKAEKADEHIRLASECAAKGKPIEGYFHTSIAWGIRSTIKDEQDETPKNHIWISYEWYRERTFSPLAAGNQNRSTRVLVIWVDEKDISTAPLLQLALLFKPFLETHPEAAISLIGPRSSSTLRDMLGGELAPKTSIAPDGKVQALINQTLKKVSLFMATPSAMDEVLVLSERQSPAENPPRKEVIDQLKNHFREVRNLAPTDDQLAREILDEMKLRDVDPVDPSNHIVLISEWDRFYGRMLSLTYAAELELAQIKKGRKNPYQLSTRSDWVSHHRNDADVWPCNLTSFVFQQGLDGQTLSKTGTETSKNNSSPSGKPGNLNDLKKWVPDPNKAEGHAQFDYLSRLANRIEELDAKLKRAESGGKPGKVSAIGIVGGDVYDTLLILQALRPRFPKVLFFTTQLDARFWQPGEWQWSRNLIVASGYGLQLESDLQDGIPPFRDDSQTAHYAAALAALGDIRLALTNHTPARRFEVGRNGAVDLSIQQGGTLHPEHLRIGGISSPIGSYGWPLVLAIAGILLLSTLAGRHWRLLTVESSTQNLANLWYREEDIGGMAGFQQIRRRFNNDADPLVRWLHKNMKLPANYPSPDVSEPELMQEFLDFMNQFIREGGDWLDEEILQQTHLFELSNGIHQRIGVTAGQLRDTNLKSGSTAHRRNRIVADHMLWDLLAPAGDSNASGSPTEEADIARMAESARQTGLVRYLVDRRNRGGLWMGTGILLVVAAGLLLACLLDTFNRPDGEPFSLSSGTSAWPAIWLRFIAIGLAVALTVRSYQGLQAGLIELTRSFRLPWKGGSEPVSFESLALPTTPVHPAYVDAEKLWEEYQQKGHWKNRLIRFVPMLLAYVIFAVGIWRLDSPPVPPVRGSIADFCETAFLIVAVASNLFLTFGMIDATRLCRWLIERLSEAPTRYPKATRAHFQMQRGGLQNRDILNEWLDLRLISELTDRVGRLIYGPFIVFFVLLLARNNWWDNWTWSMPLVVIFTLNLGFAMTSAFILQRSARRARDMGLACLNEKINRLRGDAAKTKEQKEQNDISQAEKLVDEIQSLNTGVFGSFWQNPIFGALLVPSGGTAAIEILSYLMGR